MTAESWRGGRRLRVRAGAGEVKARAERIEGRLCMQCGCTTRYVSNNNCVNAKWHPGRSAVAVEDRRRRLSAKGRGARYYTAAKPCTRCGGTLRRTNKGECADCLRRRNR